MSEKLASLKQKGGGGSLSETVLWTNPNPTSAFANTAISLSEAFTNYDVVRIYWKGQKNNSAECYIDVPSEYLKASIIDTAYRPNVYIGGYDASGTYQFIRHIYYISDTSLTITPAYRLNAAAINNDLTIPLKITGLK